MWLRVHCGSSKAGEHEQMTESNAVMLRDKRMGMSERAKLCNKLEQGLHLFWSAWPAPDDLGLRGVTLTPGQQRRPPNPRMRGSDCLSLGHVAALGTERRAQTDRLLT